MHAQFQGDPHHLGLSHRCTDITNGRLVQDLIRVRPVLYNNSDSQLYLRFSFPIPHVLLHSTEKSVQIRCTDVSRSCYCHCHQYLVNVLSAHDCFKPAVMYNVFQTINSSGFAPLLGSGWTKSAHKPPCRFYRLFLWAIRRGYLLFREWLISCPVL